MGNLERLKRCQDELHAWDGITPIEQHFLQVLPSLIDARVVAFQSFDFQAGKSQLLMDHPEPDIETHTQAFYSHVHQHPLIAATRADGTLPATRISDLTSRDDFEGTDLYNDFYRHVGFSHQVAISLPAPKGDVIGVVYSRNHDFSTTERDLLEQTRLPVLQMYGQARRFDALLRKIQTLQGMLETLDAGLIALDAAFRITQITSSARNLLKSHFPAFSHRDLPDSLANWVQKSVNAPSPESSSFLSTSNAGTLNVQLSRMPDGWLLTLDAPRPRNSRDAIARLGLTTRESEILWWMTQGKSNSEIAIILHSRPRTVEKHVEHILKKLHVETRSAAVARVNDLC